MPASNRRLTNAAAVRVLPVPVAISTSSLRRPCETSANRASMQAIWYSRSTSRRSTSTPANASRFLRAAIRRSKSSGELQRGDLPRVGVRLTVEEPDLLAVGQERER